MAVKSKGPQKIHPFPFEKPFPHCPKDLGEEITELLHQLADAIRSLPFRPVLSPHMVDAWSCLIEEWISDPKVPIVIRGKSDLTGKANIIAGRVVVTTDNSPAQWVFRMAYEGHLPTLAEIHSLFEENKFPVGQVITKAEAEVADYTEILSGRRTTSHYGWRVAHIRQIGVGYLCHTKGGGVSETDLLQTYKEHFRLFLAPWNMVLVPSSIGGLGEVKTLLDRLTGKMGQQAD